MAVGMTLHQLYSQQQQPAQGYGGDHADGAAGPASTSNHGSSGGGAAATSQGRGKADKNAGSVGGHYESMSHQQQHHPHAAYQVAPSHYPQQPPQHYGYSSQFQQQSKGAADEYAADPLPFEYHGARKYADAAGYASASAYSMSKGLDGRTQHGNYASQQQHYQPHPSDRSHYHPASEIPPAHFPHASHHTSAAQAPTHMFPVGGHSQLPLTHSFPPLIDPKKESNASAANADQTTNNYAPSSSASSHGVEYQSTASAATSGGGPQSGGAAQEAMIKVKTPLKTKYWRNGRRNLQCFPSCKVFGDYSAIKIEDLKQHDFMWGKCRGSIVTEVTLNSNVSFDDIVILGRVHSLENIPVAFEEAVIRECMLGRMVEPDVMDSMKDQWISGERLPDFVQQDGNTACFEFKPKVWKYTEDMAQGKCKRRNVKYYVQFEAFVLVMAGERRYYACIGSGMSTSFEVGSSRVLARQKRKAATNSTDEIKNGGNPVNGGGDMGGMQPMHHQQQHHPMMAPHGMMGGVQGHLGMPPSGMFQSNFHHQQHHENMPPNRGLPSPFPHQQMHQVMPQDGSHHHQQQYQQQVPPQQQMAPVVGGKRKASSDRPAYPAERASKLLKPVGGAMQSVPL